MSCSCPEMCYQSCLIGSEPPAAQLCLTGKVTPQMKPEHCATSHGELTLWGPSIQARLKRSSTPGPASLAAACSRALSCPISALFLCCAAASREPSGPEELCCCSACWLSGGLPLSLLPAEASAESAAVLLSILRLLSARSSAWAVWGSAATLLCPLLSKAPPLSSHAAPGCCLRRLSWQPLELLPCSAPVATAGALAPGSSCSLAKLRDRRSLWLSRIEAS